MSDIVLEWSENGHRHRHRFELEQPTKQPGVLRIGRDPARCDLVLEDRSVSGLHVEIFFHPAEQQIGVRNLRRSNPPLVDGQQLIQGEVLIHQGSQLHLGRLQLGVTQVHWSQAVANQSSSDGYGLKCPNPTCGKVLDYSQDRLRQGCPWCGFSLAAAQSVVILPPDS